MKKHLVIGILAHVDSGKTTLAEGLLYTCGSIRSLGRVDHKDAFLDNFELERARGITIFSKQARIRWNDMDITLLDTPGHVDFSAEMERTLQVMDYAILVISGADGVQGHVQTLWRLLKRYEIPTFLFVNKMDQPDTDKEKLLAELQSRLDGACMDFSKESFGTEGFYDALAMCDETLMEEILERGEASEENIAYAIEERKVFPCYFGSALKLWGVEELLQEMNKYALPPEYPKELGARVFKISRDSAGKRLTHVKVTGGKLCPKMLLGNEKVNEVRIYNGAGYQLAEEVKAGGICAVTGLNDTFVGQGLGYESENAVPVLEPVLTYQVMLPEDVDAVTALAKLRILEEEEPLLRIVWKEQAKEIHAQVMGEVQLEILKSQIAERFGMEVSFGNGSIVYKETIAEPVIGIGHFEPLRHYAEVHLLLEPGERGSGLQFAALCSEDMLAKNWQRLVLTHLEERKHRGVLTGSEITDMRISLVAGKAHLKHTEGGDFRQATYRAVRQGLRKAKNILLEPCFAFTLELPTECLGRAMTDIQRMCGSFNAPETVGDVSILTGEAPVSAMQHYQREFQTYTRGHGRMSCVLKGYSPCHNAEEVVEHIGYNPEADLRNPTSSVFCAHGAGFVVEYDQVENYAHVSSNLKTDESGSIQIEHAETVDGYAEVSGGKERAGQKSKGDGAGYITQEEIEEIFRQTYGKRPEDKKHFRRYHRGARRESSSGVMHGDTAGGSRKVSGYGNTAKRESYLLVDGYNIIFAWEDLRALAAVNIDSARDKLIDILSNYQGDLGSTVIVVFDAYKVKGNPGSKLMYNNVHVVYTKEAETADQYIERTVHQIAKDYQVTVATSDALEQMIIWGAGAIRLSANGLREAIDRASKELQEKYNL